MAITPAHSARDSYSAGLGYGVLSFGVTGVVTVITSVVTARLFGINVVGQFALAVAPASVLWVLSSVREQVALVRELAQLPPRAPRVTGLWYAVFAFSTSLTLAVSIAVGAIAYVLFRGPVDQPQLFAPAAACLAANVLVLNVSANLDSVFSAFIAGRTLFWVRVHEAGMLLLLSVVAALVLPTVWGLVAATYLAAVTPLIHRTISVRRYMRWRPERGELRAGIGTLPAMLRWAVKMAPGPVLTGISGQSATWMLGALSTVSAVGAFSRAQMMSARFQQLTIRIVQMLFPTLVTRRSSGDRSGFDRALIDTMRYSVAITLLLPAVAGGAAPAVMAVFGPGFTQASGALGILLFNVILGSLAIIQSYALYAVDRPGLTSWISALRLVVTLAVGFPATLAFGLEGAALGLVSGVAIDVLCKQLALRRYLSSPLQTWWPTRQILGLAATGAIGYGVSRALVDVIPYPGGLPAILLGGTAAYGLAYVALVGLTERDKARIRRIGSRLRRRRAGAVTGRPGPTGTAASEL